MVKLKSEKQVQTIIMKWLGAQPDVWAVKIEAGMQSNTVDIFGSCCAYAFLIEVKREGVDALTATTKLQRYTMEQSKTKGSAMAIATNNLADVQSLIHTLRGAGEF